MAAQHCVVRPYRQRSSIQLIVGAYPEGWTGLASGSGGPVHAPRCPVGTAYAADGSQRLTVWAEVAVVALVVDEAVLVIG